MKKRKLRARRNEQENGNQVIMKKRKDKLERAQHFQESTKSHEIKSIRMAIKSISKREETNKRAEEKKTVANSRFETQ